MSQAAAAPAAISTPGASLLPDSTDLFTAAHLLWVVAFAVLAIAVIVWGVRQKSRRKSAEREVAEHNAELRAAPPPAPTPEPVAPPAVQPDVVPLGTPAAPPMAGPAEGPVTQLKGLGPKVAERLAEQGITTVGQIAALTDDEAAALDARLGTFAGRMARDRWQEQARFLAAGDRAGFESVFGKL